MMRKISFIVILLFLSSALFAQDLYVKKQIDKGCKLALSGLTDSDYTIISYDESVNEDLKKATISITLALDGKSYYILVVDKNLKKARGRIDDEVERSLKYVKTLDSDLTLDYEFDTSFSSILPEQVKNGSTFVAKGMDGESYGLLTVRNEKDATVTHFDALFNKGLKPGLMLEKSGANLLSFAFKINPYKVKNTLCYGFNLGYKNLSLIYPFAPSCGFFVDIIGAKAHYLFSLGLDYYLPLSTFFTSSFPLVQDANISAGLSLLLGTEGHSFLVGVQSEIFYNLFINCNWYICLGFSTQALSSSSLDYKLHSYTNYIQLKGGVRF